MRLQTEQMKAWAIEGARAEVARLRERLETIQAAFPELQRAEEPAAINTRLHWTQTPAGKRKMAAAQRRAWKTRKANGK